MAERCFDRCWMVWFRNGLHSDGEWIAWEYTHSITRHDSIKAFEKFWGTERPNPYRNLRRKGLVRCVKTELVADLPPTEEPEL